MRLILVELIMQISSVNKSLYSFKAKYPTEDVLAFTTQYLYKNKDVQASMVKSLTGIDMESDEFKKVLPDSFDRNVAELAITFLSIDKVLSQNEELRAVDETFVPKPRCKEFDKEHNDWFKEKIKKLGKTLEIKPFTLTKEEIKDEFEILADAINQIF